VPALDQLRNELAADGAAGADDENSHCHLLVTSVVFPGSSR
jgi:hypothetical protein